MDFLPSSSGNPLKLPFRQRLFIFILALVVVGLVVMYVLEFRHFENTFGVRSLVLWSMITGLIIGLGVAWFFREKDEDFTEQMQIYVFFGILGLVFMPLLGSLSNRLLSFSPIEKKAVVFYGGDTRFSDRFGVIKGEEPQAGSFYIFVVRDGKMERLKVRDLNVYGVEKGESILLPVKKGLWGYEVFVDESGK